MDDIFDAAEAYLRRLFAGESSGHDLWHSLRVARTAEALQAAEGGELSVIRLSALLHDVDDAKLFPGHRDCENARAFLAAQGVDAQTTERVCRCIAQVSFKGSASVRPDTLEGQIVQDADRLDAIGAIGIARVFAFGGSRGRAMHDPAERSAGLMDEQAYRAHQGTSINHFYEKLLLLKDRMNTGAAKALAEKRHAFMETYLAEFYREWDGLT